MSLKMHFVEQYAN